MFDKSSNPSRAFSEVGISSESLRNVFLFRPTKTSLFWVNSLKMFVTSGTLAVDSDLSAAALAAYPVFRPPWDVRLEENIGSVLNYFFLVY